jgi:DNA-binding PucR family transcriptional regulator
VVSARGPLTVLAFQAQTGDPRVANPERILSIVSLLSENAHPEAMCALIDDRFWALVPLPGGREQERSIELAEQIVRRVEAATPVRLNAGIGVPVATVADVPRSRRAAEQALRVRAQRGDGARVVHIGHVRAHAVLLDLLDLASANPGLREGKLADLLAADPEHAAQRRETLRAYLDCAGNVAMAAERLGVHPNTLRYRVRRAVELSGLDLDDPDERLVTELQLRMAGPPRPARVDGARGPGGPEGGAR